MAQGASRDNTMDKKSILVVDDEFDIVNIIKSGSDER